MGVIDEAFGEDGIRFRVLVQTDTDCEDPREYEGLGHIVHVKDTAYTVPQEGPMAQAIAEAAGDHPFHVVARWLRVFHDAVVVLPLEYRALAAGNILDNDTVGNYFGVTYVTKEEALKAGFVLADTHAIADALSTDCETYGQWAEGEVYGVTVEHEVDGVGWEYDDSSWGLIGEDYAKEEAQRMLEQAVSDHDANVVSK